MHHYSMHYWQAHRSRGVQEQSGRQSEGAIGVGMHKPAGSWLIDTHSISVHFEPTLWRVYHRTYCYRQAYTHLHDPWPSLNSQRMRIEIPVHMHIALYARIIL